MTSGETEMSRGCKAFECTRHQINAPKPFTRAFNGLACTGEAKRVAFSLASHGPNVQPIFLRFCTEHLHSIVLPRPGTIDWAKEGMHNGQGVCDSEMHEFDEFDGVSFDQGNDSNNQSREPVENVRCP